jgi:hypothetical protein
MKKNYFIFDKEAKSATTHLAINKYCSNLINEGSADCIVRFYYHNNAVILANAESISDINENNAKQLGFEVLRRPSGGSVIVATPKDMLCYSIFLPTEIFDKKTASSYYKKFTFPLASKLGSEFEIAGAYYLRYQKQPIAGHAMKTEKKYVQIDGLIHTQKPDIDLISKLIHLRELYKTEFGDSIKMNGNFYFKDKILENYNENEFEFLYSEKELISNFPGLNSTPFTPETYSQKIKETLEELIKSKVWKEKLELNIPIIKKYQKEINEELQKPRHQIAQGHCFVDFSEPEPEIHVLDEIYK